MTLLQALILGLVQGITEFVPISSSGHLVLAEEFLGLKAANLLEFDIVVHVGTLIAAVVYFSKDWKELFLAIFNPARQQGRRLLALLAIGTLPAVVVAILIKDLLVAFRAVQPVLILMIVAAAFFLVAERASLAKKATHMLWWHALVIGVAQAVAILPGVSRSGTTIAAGLLVGQERREAARFSFLLGGIAILGAAVLTAKDVIAAGTFLLPAGPILVGFFAALFAGYLSIDFMMRFLKRYSLDGFAVYLVIVGVGGLVLS